MFLIMNKSNKVFEGIIIVLIIALIIMSILYFDMIAKAKKNLNDFLNQCEVTSNLYKELDELKNNDNNLDGNFLFSEEGK